MVHGRTCTMPRCLWLFASCSALDLVSCAAAHEWRSPRRRGRNHYLDAGDFRAAVGAAVDDGDLPKAAGILDGEGRGAGPAGVGQAEDYRQEAELGCVVVDVGSMQCAADVQSCKRQPM